MGTRKISLAHRMAAFASDHSKGLTKIEMFTMAALQGLCANKSITNHSSLQTLEDYNKGEGPAPGGEIAQLAFEIALHTLNELHVADLPNEPGTLSREVKP